jgi:hypothetical protein
MTCINCETEISNRYDYKICSDCKYSDAVMISLTEAKRKYKLTDEEIDEAELFYIQFTVHRNLGTKFLISEIHELARKLTKNLDMSDKKRVAFSKFDDLYAEKKRIEEEFKKFKQNIVVHIKDIASKHEIVIDDFMDNLITEFVDNDYSHCREENVKITDVWNDVHKCYNKKVFIDTFLREEFGDENLDVVKEYPQYKKTITNIKVSNDASYTILRNELLKNIKIKNKKKHINHLIKDTYGEEYIVIVTKSSIYNNYLYDNDIDVLDDKILINLKNIAKRVITKEQRTKTRDNKLSSDLSKYLNKREINFTKKSDIYKNFVNNGRGIKKVIEDLVEYVDINKKRCKRNIVITRELKKNRLTNYICVDLINKYICDDAILLDDIIKLIKQSEEKIVRKKIIDRYIYENLYFYQELAKTDFNYERYIEKGDIFLENYAEYIKTKIDREKQINKIIDKELRKYEHLVKNHPDYFNYLNNQELPINKFQRKILDEIDKIGIDTIDAISRPDISTINTILLNFYNNNNNKMYIYRKKWQAMTYIKYICEKYNFVCRYDNKKNTYCITKSVKQLYHENEPSVDFYDITKLIKKFNDSKIKHERIMNEYNKIKNLI